MPAPPAIPRQARTLAALIGCALAIGMAREAGAASCHVVERPVFGLSTEPAEPTIPPEDAVAPDVEPIRVDPRCPSDHPERPSSPPGPAPGALASEGRRGPPPPDLIALHAPGDGGARPIRVLSRLDRPPRDR